MRTSCGDSASARVADVIEQIVGDLESGHHGRREARGHDFHRSGIFDGDGITVDEVVDQNGGDEGEDDEQGDHGWLLFLFRSFNLCRPLRAIEMPQVKLLTMRHFTISRVR